MIYLQLFWCFIQVGLFSVGGGYAAMPIIQSQVVGHLGWLTMEEFSNLIAIADITPGPIAVNSATFVGLQLAGIGGAVVATIGCILPSIIMVSLLSWLYLRYREGNAMQTVLSSLRPAVVALIAGAAVMLLEGVVFPTGTTLLADVNWLGIGLGVLAFVVLRKLKWSPIPVMLGCGVTYLLISMALGLVG